MKFPSTHLQHNSRHPTNEGWISDLHFFFLFCLFFYDLYVQLCVLEIWTTNCKYEDLLFSPHPCSSSNMFWEVMLVSLFRQVMNSFFFFLHIENKLMEALRWRGKYVKMKSTLPLSLNKVLTSPLCVSSHGVWNSFQLSLIRFFSPRCS